MEAKANELRGTNRRLAGLLEELSGTNMAAPAVATKMEMILTELLRAGGWFQNAAVAPLDRELQDEMNRYRWNLERLQALLPEVHAKLLVERARLESERTHLEAANAWAQASRHIES
jgi:hypothetical protein